MKNNKKTRQNDESQEEVVPEDNQDENMQEDLDLTVSNLSKQIISLSEQLQDAKRREQLSLADYQNLVRRTSKERSRVAKLAAGNFVEDLMQPLNHLSLASEQLNDAGLTMVVAQLWQALEQNGLKKIDLIGKEFDVNTMEATESGEFGEKVIKVVTEGYTLNDEVVQHAKVILD
jgi:molecular chaperone GrpE